MKKIAIVTTTRAEYGILSPLIKRCRRETDFETKLVVTGTHLSERYGKTISEIEEDGVAVDAVIPILDEREGAVGVSGTIANALCAFTDYFLQVYYLVAKVAIIIQITKPRWVPPSEIIV